MDIKLLLVKAITLLYRESQLNREFHLNESSADLIRNVITDCKVSDIGIGLNTDRETILGLKSTALEMVNNPIDYEYDLDTLLQSIKVHTGHNEKLYEALNQGVTKDLNEKQLQRSILNTRKSITDHYREEQITNILSKTYFQFRNERDKIKDIGNYVTEFIEKLEPFQLSSTLKDPAILDDIDIGNEGDVAAVFDRIRKNNSNEGILKTGWQALNTMLQGGFRRGEFVGIGALQHKYKTGFTLSLFKQIALYNKPLMLDPTKKPLLLRISFEDDAGDNLQFLYQALMYDETRKLVTVADVADEEMSLYIKSRLQVNGYHTRLLRVDPTQWTFKHICNKVIEFEADGYEVHLLMLDYLGKVPTTGCITTGPMGTDRRDMFRRMRNFCAARKTTLITPHQLSGEAKNMIRNGVPENLFVKEVAEKGYWDGSKQLCQEMDVELHIHKFYHNKEHYFSVQRGKHRLPTIIGEDEKYFLLKFPYKMPIPDDINGEDSAMRKLPTKSSGGDSLFQF